MSRHARTTSLHRPTTSGAFTPADGSLATEATVSGSYRNARSGLPSGGGVRAAGEEDSPRSPPARPPAKMSRSPSSMVPLKTAARAGVEGSGRLGASSSSASRVPMKRAVVEAADARATAPSDARGGRRGLDGPPASPGWTSTTRAGCVGCVGCGLPRLGAGGSPGALSSEGDARTPRGVAREAAPSSGARGASGTRAGARGPDEEEDHAPTRARANDADAADDAIAACAIDRREGRLGRVRATRVVVRVETRQPRTSKPSHRTRHVAVTAPRIRASASRLKKPPSARCPSPSTRPPQRAWSQRNSLQSTLLLKRVPDFKDDTSYE